MGLKLKESKETFKNSESVSNKSFIAINRSQAGQATFCAVHTKHPDPKNLSYLAWTLTNTVAERTTILTSK